MSDDKMKGLGQAREARTLEKRRVVERAIVELQEQGNPITYTAIAALGNVSRKYLYNKIEFRPIIFSNDPDKIVGGNFIQRYSRCLVIAISLRL